LRKAIKEKDPATLIEGKQMNVTSIGEFEQLVKSIPEELNTRVFPFIDMFLSHDPRIRSNLNPAFPFPRQLRIGVLSTHLVVEYVGPEDPKNKCFDVEGLLRTDWTVLDFLGINLEHLRNVSIPISA